MDTPENDIADLFDRVSGEMRARSGRMVADAGLSRFEFVVMSHLLYARRRAEPATLERLSDHLDLTKEQVLDTLTSIARRGYASRSGSHPTVWALSREGERIIAPIMETIAQGAERSCEGMDAEELATLTGALRKMLRNARQESGG